jgi:hypothetical protein
MVPFFAMHNWWLSDYRSHPDLSGNVKIHQYTSSGGPGGSSLDRSRVLDNQWWDTIIGKQPNQPEAKVPNVYLMHRPANSPKGHGTGFLVRDEGIAKLSGGTAYAAIRDKGGVRDAGELDDDSIDAILASSKSL